MDLSLSKTLMEWGLTEKEAQVYLATLEFGSATVNEIAKRTKIFRTYCYDIIRSLTGQGLVSSITRKGVQYFKAANPSKLVGLLEEKKGKIKEVLPQLQALSGSAGKLPQAVLFEGVEGIKSIHEDILASQTKSYVIGSTEKIVGVLGPFFSLYVKRRKEKKLHAFVITEDTPSTRKIVGLAAKKELRHVRFNKELAGNSTTIYLYNNKVAILTYEKEPFGVITENKALYSTFRLLFDVLWKATPS